MTGSELESYIQLFHKSVYRLALSYVKNEAEAEDVNPPIQKIHRRRKSYKCR